MFQLSNKFSINSVANIIRIIERSINQNLIVYKVR